MILLQLHERCQLMVVDREGREAPLYVEPTICSLCSARCMKAEMLSLAHEKWLYLRPTLLPGSKHNVQYRIRIQP